MNVTGAVKVIDFPDDTCLTTVKALLMDLERYLAIELKVESITNVFVTSTEPDAADRDIIWFRIDTAGNFIGIFIYVQGQWVQMFPAPNQIIRMYGNSNDIPIGFALIDANTPGFTSAMVTAITDTWLLDSTNSYYVIFDVVYVGL